MEEHLNIDWSITKSMTFFFNALNDKMAKRWFSNIWKSRIISLIFLTVARLLLFFNSPIFHHVIK